MRKRLTVRISEGVVTLLDEMAEEVEMSRNMLIVQSLRELTDKWQANTKGKTKGGYK